MADDRIGFAVTNLTLVPTRRVPVHVRDPNGRVLQRWRLRGFDAESEGGIWLTYQGQPGIRYTIIVDPVSRVAEITKANNEVTVECGIQPPYGPGGPQVEACVPVIRTEHGQPDDLAWDGELLWGVNLQGTDTISVVDPRRGVFVQRIGTYRLLAVTSTGRQARVTVPFTGLGLTGIAWDGQHLWLATWGGQVGQELAQPVILKLEPETTADGRIRLRHVGELRYRPHDQGGRPRGLAWDGQDLWAADGVLGRVYRLDERDSGDGRIRESFASPSRNGEPTGLTYDGRYLWLATYQDRTLWQLDPRNNGRVIASFPTCCAGPTGLAWADGLMVGDDSSDVIHFVTPGGRPPGQCPVSRATN